MKKVTAEEFIRIATERMGRGQTYEQATSSLMMEEETERSPLEITAADLRTPLTEYADDGEESGGTEGMSSLEWAEQEAIRGGRYDAIGWQDPPGSPEDEIIAYEDREFARLVYQALSKAQREAVRLVVIEGHTHEEAAKLTGVGRTAITRMLGRGIAAMREQFGIERPTVRSARPTQEAHTASVYARIRARQRALDMRTARVREQEAFAARGEEWTLKKSKVLRRYTGTR